MYIGRSCARGELDSYLDADMLFVNVFGITLAEEINTNSTRLVPHDPNPCLGSRHTHLHDSIVSRVSAGRLCLVICQIEEICPAGYDVLSTLYKFLVEGCVLRK